MKTSKMTTSLLGAVVATSAIAVLSLSSSAPATNGIGNAWQSTYPSSTSRDNANNCNLCHADGGGSNWNSYGKDMLDLLDAGSSTSQAFAILESMDSDMDPTGSTNLEEINANTQPGWTPGPNNTLWFGENPSPNQEPAPDVTGDLDPTSCPADLDGNGSVGFADLTIVLNSWGPCPAPPAPCDADLDGNGSVGFADLTIVLNSWGECP